MMSYLNRISSHILPSEEKDLEDPEIKKMSVKKSMWSKHFVVSKKKKLADFKGSMHEHTIF